MTRGAGALLVALVGLAGCSKNEPPTQASTTPPAPPAAIVAPAPPPPEPVAMQPAVPQPAVEQHIPGTPEAKQFIAANVVKSKPKKARAPKAAPVPESAYEKAYRNAARADKLLQRHAYVVSFDDTAATNAVPLGREYR